MIWLRLPQLKNSTQVLFFLTLWTREDSVTLVDIFFVRPWSDSKISHSIDPHSRCGLRPASPALGSSPLCVSQQTKEKTRIKRVVFFCCGPERTRTPYLLSASEALYQVSYWPIVFLHQTILSINLTHSELYPNNFS